MTQSRANRGVDLARLAKEGLSARSDVKRGKRLYNFDDDGRNVAKLWPAISQKADKVGRLPFRKRRSASSADLVEGVGRFVDEVIRTCREKA